MAITDYELGSQNLTSPTVTDDRPFTMADMDMDSTLLLKAIERKMNIEATLCDPYVAKMANVVAQPTGTAIPDDVFLNVKAQAVGTRQTTVPFLRPLAGAIRQGNAEQQKGFGREMNMKYTQMFYNEYSQAVVGAEWGVDANDVAQFNLYSYIQPQLSKYFMEMEGKWVREAILRKYAGMLTAAPVSATQHWNKNWFIANTNFGSQPAYHQTEATFRGYITTALAAAATGTSGVNANIDIDYLLALNYFAKNTRKITPIKMGGKDTYICVIPSPQMAVLLSLVDGQAGGLWQNTASLSKEEATYPGAIGRIKDLLIVEDPRYPTLVESGGSFTVEYVYPGNQDARNTSVYNSSSNKAWDMGALLGQAALYKWTVKPLHFETETTEFGKLYEKAAFGESGIGLIEYDQDTESSTTRLNYGSCVLAFSSTNIVTTA